MAMNGPSLNAGRAWQEFARGAWLAAWLGVAPLTVWGHGTFHARLEAIQEKLALAPSDPGIHFNLAELYCEHEQPTEALAELALVDQLGAGDLPVAYLRGMALGLAGQPEPALVCFDQFVATHPNNAPGRVQRARIHLALRQTDAALADYRAALVFSANPEPDLLQETADALAKAGRGAEALQVLQTGMNKLGTIPSLSLRALELEITTGNFEAALARVDALEKTAPRPEPWMARRADVLKQAGRIAEARQAWSALIDHLTALPAPQRSSHAMSRLAEQARDALAAL